MLIFCALSLFCLSLSLACCCCARWACVVCVCSVLGVYFHILVCMHVVSAAMSLCKLPALCRRQLPSFPCAHARQAARNCSCLSSLSLSSSCSPFSGSHLASCCCSCCCCYCCFTLCCFQFCLLLFSHFFASLFNKCLVHSAYAMLTAGSAMLFLLRF